MSKKNRIVRLWDSLDRVWEHPDDVPYPEGAEINEADFDAIADDYEEDLRIFRETGNDFKNNPLTIIGK